MMRSSGIRLQFLGDNATKDFILRHVFEIEPALIKTPSDLLRVLLRRHYRKQRIPDLLDEWFVRILRQQGSFDDWPLETIIPEREAFFAFLQERWPAFLDQLANQDGTGVREKEKVYGFELPGPADLPFDHDDVRIYIDNLFLEGLLQAVPHEQAESCSKSWLLIGIRTDDQADRTRRVEGLLDALASCIPKEDTRHEDWFHFARNWAELVALVLDPVTSLPEPALRRKETLQAQIDIAFVPWLAKRYAGLINLPPVPPVMLHHVPRHLARQRNGVGGSKSGFGPDRRSRLAPVDRHTPGTRQTTSWVAIPRKRRFCLDTDHHVRFTPGRFCGKTTHLLSGQYPYHGQGTCFVVAVLGGPGAVRA